LVKRVPGVGVVLSLCIAGVWYDLAYWVLYRYIRISSTSSIRYGNTVRSDYLPIKSRVYSVGPLASFSCRTSVPLPIRAEYGTHHSLNGGFLAVNKYCSSPHRSRRSFNPFPTTREWEAKIHGWVHADISACCQDPVLHMT